ncbi:MAG: T9SS type A sorting domain-containing protein [Bacteroidota bacterium]
MLIRKILPSILLFLCPVMNSFSQVTIGEWSDHLTYNEAILIADAGERVFCVSRKGAIFYYMKEDASLGKISTIQGLSGIDISALRYHKTKNILFIGYENGNIDLYSKEGIRNIPDIANAYQITNRRINNISFHDNTAYLACGFGIVAFNLDKNEITDTYYIGENGTQIEVLDVATGNNSIVAATAKGIYMAELDDPNLVNYRNWFRDVEIEKATGRFVACEILNDKIIVSREATEGSNDPVYYLENGTWVNLNVQDQGRTFFIEKGHDRLLITKIGGVAEYNNQMQRTGIWGNYYSMQSLHDINDPGIIWAANRQTGLVKIQNNQIVTDIYPNGPATNFVNNLSAGGNLIYAVPGGINAGFVNSWIPAQLFIYNGKTWETITLDNTWDFLNVVVNPFDLSEVFVASWGGGFNVFKNGSLEIQYKETNSCLQNAIPGSHYLRVFGIAMDNDQNLWITNSDVPDPIAVFTADGECYNLPYGNYTGGSRVGHIITTPENQKWMQIFNSSDILVFDEKGTYEDLSDDDIRKLPVYDSEGNTISGEVVSMAYDLDGNIWVGTGNGPVVYHNPPGVFEESFFYASKILIPREDKSGLADPLLENERINAIAVDGANRKWLGTQNSGVFLLSEDGLEEIHHFTSANSPLYSNTVKTIAINHESGEVFFGTEKGIISFRSDATKGATDFSDVYVFPNPVRENHQGPITITGLVSDVNVKITDVSGNLVHESTALGGQAIWDGKNLDGRRVKTGVYLVFCTNEDGSQTHVTKLLFIN